MEFFPLVLLVLAFLLLIVLPSRQRKRAAAQQQQMQEALQPGAPIMTTSGIHGTVVSRTDTTVDVEIAPGVVVTFVRQAILEVRKPDTDAPTDAPTDALAATEDAPGGALPDESVPGAVDGGPADPTR